GDPEARRLSDRRATRVGVAGDHADIPSGAAEHGHRARCSNAQPRLVEERLKGGRLGRGRGGPRGWGRARPEGGGFGTRLRCERRVEGWLRDLEWRGEAGGVTSGESPDHGYGGDQPERIRAPAHRA